MTDTAPHLSLRDLRAGYGRSEVLHGVTLNAQRGQSICIVGPNGSGKTTVLNAIFGIADVFGGGITLGGRDITRMPQRARITETKIAYVLQSDASFLDMTVEENLMMGGHLLPSRDDAREAAERIFEAYPFLAARRRHFAGELSGGQRRTLEFLCALVARPEILLVDEPSIGLEPRAVDDIFRLLRKLQTENGMTVIVVEQNVAKGLQFAELGCVMVAGRPTLIDDAREILKNRTLMEHYFGGLSAAV